MNYYYDVKLNFLSELYNFYEWDELDNIMDVQKIPIVKISFNDFLKFYTNKIKIELDFLEKIKNKTIIKNGLLEYACIFTDTNNAIGVLFNESGESILFSSLSYNDELNIEEVGYKLKKEKINYSVVESNIVSKSLRFENKIKSMVKNEIENMIENKNYSKLKYIYNVVNKINEKNLDLIIENLNNIKDNELLNFYEIMNFNTKNV